VNPLTHLNATEWLLVGLFCVFLLGLIGVAITHMMASEVDDTNEPTYRTADANAIRLQTARIIANAAAHASAPNLVDPNTTTTRREGTVAAIRDMGRKFGTPATPNPHSSDTQSYFVWRDAYDRACDVLKLHTVP